MTLFFSRTRTVSLCFQNWKMTTFEGSNALYILIRFAVSAQKNDLKIDISFVFFLNPALTLCYERSLDEKD